MGYDTHLIIGRIALEREEIEKDLNKPYEDGSGYEYKKDKKGNPLLTGRTECWLDIYAEISLCKIYKSALDSVHTQYKESPLLGKDHFVFVYQKDGNTQYTKDPYGDPLIVAPFQEVLDAVRKDSGRCEYRRFKWLLALLESMKDEKEELVCAFYGS